MTSSTSRLPLPCLALVTDRKRSGGRDLVEVVKQAVEGGVNMVQLREKDLPVEELRKLAERVLVAIAGRALLLVNERLDVAMAVRADGVQFPERSRQSTRGNGMIVGRSVHSVEAAEKANREGASFVQVGTVFPSLSHVEREASGVGLLTAVSKVVSVPIVAIGGIDATNASMAIEAGADGVAVISAVMAAPDPRKAASELWRVVSASYGGDRRRATA